MKCSYCGSENIEISEHLDEGDQVLKPYAECKNCGNAWEMDPADVPLDAEADEYLALMRSPCEACGGSRVCPHCSGTGYDPVEARPIDGPVCGGDSHCPDCTRQNRCPYCGGPASDDPIDIDDNLVRCGACQEPFHIADAMTLSEARRLFPGLDESDDPAAPPQP